MQSQMTFYVVDTQFLNITSKTPFLQLSPEYLKSVQNPNKPEMLKSYRSSRLYKHIDLGNSGTENLTEHCPLLFLQAGVFEYGKHDLGGHQAV